MHQSKEWDSGTNSIDSGFASSCWTRIVRLRHDQTAEQIRHDENKYQTHPWQRQLYAETFVHGLLEGQST